METISVRRMRLAGTAALALAMMGLAVAAQAQDVVKIGITGPLSGPAAQSGLALRQGMTVAADEWNTKGGVTIDGKPRKIELLFEDTQDNPAQGVSAAQKLITDNHVNFLIGDAFASSVTMAVMDLADQYKIPIMGCEPVSGAISAKVEKDPQKYRYFWKADFNSQGYAATIFGTYDYLIKSGQFKPIKKTVAFLVEDTDYGRSIAANTVDQFKADGWDVIANNTVPLGSTNFSAVLAKVGYQSPEVLVSVFTSVDSGVALSKQFIEQGLKSSQFAIFYPTRPAYLKGAGKAGESLMWAPLLFDPAQMPPAKALDGKIQAKYGNAGTSDHAYGYDCMNIVLEAFKTAKTAKPESVVKVLAATNYKGTLGVYVFDQKNHTAQYGPDRIPIPTAQIRDGRNVIIWPPNVVTGKYEVPRWMK
jgi:branched-chain amino acid transport system substrate-binding protein